MAAETDDMIVEDLEKKKKGKDEMTIVFRRLKKKINIYENRYSIRGVLYIGL